MTNVEIFHREMTRLGGRLKLQSGSPAEAAYATVTDRARLLISSARELLPHLPHIHFDFVLNGDINAYAFKSEGRYFIGITTGALYMLELVFMRMLSDSRLFDSIGNPNEESNNLPPLVGYAPQAQQMYESGLIPGHPNTIPRLSYARHLSESAFIFLLGHELAHITLGHIDYLQSKTGTAIIEELDWNQRDSGDLIERQSLEAMADNRSVLSGIDSIQLTHGTPGFEKPPWTNSALKPAERIFDWALAMNSLFRLFGDSRFNPSNLEMMAYPPFPIRRAMATAAAYTFVMTEYPALKDKALDALRLAMAYTEAAFSMILGIDQSAEGLRDAYSSSGKEHYKRLVAYWHGDLRERLATFSYEDLLTDDVSDTKPVL